MGTHQYEGSDREAMAPSNQDFLKLLHQQSPRHQQQQILAQEYPNYPPFKESNETHLSKFNLELPTMAPVDEICGLKSWGSRNYTSGKWGQSGGECGPIGSMGFGDMQSLSLSICPGSQSTSCVTLADCVPIDTKKRGSEKMDQKQISQRKSTDTFGQRTSLYRGVTRLFFFTVF